MKNGSSFHDHQSGGPGAVPVQLIYTPELNTIKKKRVPEVKTICSVVAGTGFTGLGFIRRKKTHLELQTLQFRLNTYLCFGDAVKVCAECLPALQ